MKLKSKKFSLFAILVAGMVFSLSGCSLVNNKPSTDFIASPTRGTEPLDVTFDATVSSDSDGKLVNYNWNFGDGTRSSGENVNHTYNSAGEYTVELTVTDDGGKMDTMIGLISVSPENHQPSADIIAEPLDGEAPLYVYFDGSNSTDPDGSIESFSWNFGDGSTEKGAEVGHTYDKEGTYEVELKVTDADGVSDSKTIKVDVAAHSNETPVAKFSADPTSGTAPLYVKFDASNSHDPDGEVVSYHWDFNEYTSEGTGMVISNTFDYGDEFVVELTVTDDEGAEDTATKMIDVESGTGCQ